MPQYEAESQAGPSGATPRGDVTQGGQPKSKRETSARASGADGERREPEGKQRKTGEPGAMTQKWPAFVSSPVVVVVDQAAASQEASSSSQGPRSAPIGTAAPNKRNTVERESQTKAKPLRKPRRSAASV